MTPRVSVVVNTLDRPDGLRRTLHSLYKLDYPEFEVVVVVGPSGERTQAVVQEFADTKVLTCPVANLSISRNLGIRHSSAELIAFIDDDAVPDPWWLDELVPAFEDIEVAAVGGPIYDFDGSLFSTYALCDTHGDASIRNEGSITSTVFAAPRTDLFVTTIGTNSVFRRSALVDIGGFDEEFDRYMDETDVCRRLVDRGWIVEASDYGFVQHIRDPSAVRGANRVLLDLYPLLKSRMYFALRHARPRVGLLEVARRYEQAVERWRQERRSWLQQGVLTSDDVEKFERDAIRAADDALQSARHDPPIHAASWFDAASSTYLRVSRSLPARRLHICVVSHEYVPKQLNGIGRLSHELARSLAERGHVVRVLTEGYGRRSVSLEEGVWVHRVVPKPATPPNGVDIPSWLWNFSTQVLSELQQIHDIHSVDIVQMPNWNSEGIAVLSDGRFRTVLGLHTPLKTIARVEPSVAALTTEVRQLLALELRCYELATAFLACGPASLGQIEEEYALQLPRERIGFVPFGMSDTRSVDPLRFPGRVNVLFVGRLEARKGIDTLFDAVARLLSELPDVVFTFVGRNDITSDSGGTFRDDFERATDPALRDGKVFFKGVVSDEELSRYYAGCDIFVAPSRHESFGLILLEAMREGKPVVAGDVGGMREVVEHEGNGLLIPPGDARALAEALSRLVTSPPLREHYGRRSREIFEERYTATRMAESYERFCMTLVEHAVAR